MFQNTTFGFAAMVLIGIYLISLNKVVIVEIKNFQLI